MADVENEKTQTQPESVPKQTENMENPLENAAPTAATPAPPQAQKEGGGIASALMKEAVSGPGNQLEANMYKHFMNPMLSRMEDSVKRNNEILDNIQKKWDDEREERRKKDLSKHIPGPLQGHGQNLEDIMKRIQDLIVYENFNDSEDTSKLVPARLKTLDENAEVAILSHSVAAFVSTLELTHLRQFTTRIVSDTTLWTSRLFRFNEASAYFHEEEREGLLRVCRLAIHRHYPKFASDGYEALYARPPSIYISAASKPGLGQYLCSQLGLPISCLCTVPCSTVSGATQKMDLVTLEKLIEDDVASGKTPVLLVAYAGTPLVGHVDNIQKLQEICKKSEIWLHIEGNNLATLTMYSVPTSISPAKSGDSMTLNLSSWLGLPAIPFVTLYKTADPAMAHASGLTSFNARYKLNALPLWLCLQNLGHEGVVNRVKHAIDLAKQLSSQLDKISNIKQIGKKDPNAVEDPAPKKMGIGDLISKAISALIIFEIENPTVVFRYQESKKEGEKKDGDTESQAGDVDDLLEKDPYFDALNLWLSETMKREIPKVGISTVEVDGEGVCVRFSPLESSHTLDTQPEEVTAFMKCLNHQLRILNATVGQRQDFQDIVAAQDNMQLVSLPNWAGLGAVQYIPEQYAESKVDSLPETARREINQLNTQLVQQLKSADTAFSLGMTQESLACVRFGLIMDETDLEELIALVYTTGKEVEESSKFLETMTEVVKQGIEKANEDLVKENQDKLVQEGVLRQVPLVGSLLNWWSPPAKEAGVKGRTFNLSSGQIESTEGTYKYHMQIQQSPDTSQTKIRSGPLKANLRPVKRRTLSSGSAGSVTSNDSKVPAENSLSPNTSITQVPEEKVQDAEPVELDTDKPDTDEVSSTTTATSAINEPQDPPAEVAEEAQEEQSTPEPAVTTQEVAESK